MCGLFGGFSSILSHSEIDTIKTLGLVSNLRGMHSTGVIMGNRNGKKKKGNKISWKRSLGPSIPMLFGDDLREKTKMGTNPFLMAGHTRYATIGDVTVKNAHPFHKGAIVGMHNGTAPSYKRYLSDATDSENIMDTINREGLEETLKKFEYSDAFALVWVDMKANKLMLIRNHERTLWIMRNKALNTVLWSSEKGMLTFAGDRSNTSYNEPILLDTGVLYSFDLNNSSLMERTDMNEHMPKKPNLPVVVGGMDWSYYNDNELWKPPENRQEPKHKPKVVESDFIKSRKCTVNGEEMAEVADGFFMNLQDIDDAINNGCGMCNSVPEGEAEKIKAGKNSSVRWYSTDEYICSDCATPEVLSVFPCMKKPKTKEM